MLKCDACYKAGILLRKQYNPHMGNDINEIVNIHNIKNMTVQHYNSRDDNSEFRVEEQGNTIQFPNAIFIEKLRELANLLKKDAVHKCDYCMFENQTSEALCR
ncbi:unnamed protein product [Heterobilharzia americana]|nr:unnamed protein product [Heterobilharzia americana]